QLAGSFCVSTQMEPPSALHSVVPPRQVTPHLPVEQTWPVGHAFPHAPQLAGSFCVATQEAPQSVAPPLQARPPSPPPVPVVEPPPPPQPLHASATQATNVASVMPWRCHPIFPCRFLRFMLTLQGAGTGECCSKRKFTTGAHGTCPSGV